RTDYSLQGLVVLGSPFSLPLEAYAWPASEHLVLPGRRRWPYAPAAEVHTFGPGPPADLHYRRVCPVPPAYPSVHPGRQAWEAWWAQEVEFAASPRLSGRPAGGHSPWRVTLRTPGPV